LEEIYACPRDTGTWKKVSFQSAFSDLKQGIAEEIAILLSDDKKHISKLPSIEKTIEFNKLAEKIFGYK